MKAESGAAQSACDDYATAEKSQIDWDDRDAREVLIASRARDGYAVLAELVEPVRQAAALLATVLARTSTRVGTG